MRSNSKYLKLPSGNLASKWDRLVVLQMWREHLQLNNNLTIVDAGSNSPSLPINLIYAIEMQHQWIEYSKPSTLAEHYWDTHPDTAETIDHVAKIGKASNYGSPYGDEKPTTQIAKTLTRYYNNKITIDANHILITMGNRGGLSTLFTTLDRNYPNTWIMITSPSNAMVDMTGKSIGLHPIPLIKEPGKSVTRQSLEKSMRDAKKRNRKIKAFFFSDPNDALGMRISESAWQDIAEWLKLNEGLIIIKDDMSDLSLDGKRHPSLLEIAPDLYHRTILLRDMTMGMSTVGEPIAVCVTPDSELLSLLSATNISHTGHAPRMDQQALACAFDAFYDEDRNRLVRHYKPQVNLAEKLLSDLGAAIPDPNYQVQVGYSVLANLDDFIGLELPRQVCEMLGKSGVIETDEDIAYYLLFKSILVAPLSYFGADPNLGFVKITCSGGDTKIKTIRSLLEDNLVIARQAKKTRLATKIAAAKKSLSETDNTDDEKSTPNSVNLALQLKADIQLLEKELQILTARLAAVDHQKKRLFIKNRIDTQSETECTEQQLDTTIKVLGNFFSKLLASSQKKYRNTLFNEAARNNILFHNPSFAEAIANTPLRERYKMRTWISFLQSKARARAEQKMELDEKESTISISSGLSSRKS